MHIEDEKAFGGVGYNRAPAIVRSGSGTRQTLVEVEALRAGGIALGAWMRIAAQNQVAALCKGPCVLWHWENAPFCKHG